MTIKVSKPAINIREELADLKQDTGLKGQELMRADTVAEARTAISAGRKNLIINGGMQVAQRGTSFTAQAYTLDRWSLNLSGGSATVTWNEFTRGSELDGIKNYLKLNVTTGDNYMGLVYKVEGARALPTGKATLSWWAKGVNPASGEIVCNMQLINNGSTNFNTPLADTFSVTSEWQKYTRTVDIPDYTGMGSETSDGSWTYLRFSQESGDTSTDAWSLDITGVQLEVGSVATEFEHRSYGEELALCQRYYERFVADASQETLVCNGLSYTTTRSLAHVFYLVEKRVKPTFSLNSSSDFQALTGSSGGWQTATGVSAVVGLRSARLDVTGLSGLTASGACEIRLQTAANGAHWFAFDAEL